MNEFDWRTPCFTRRMRLTRGADYALRIMVYMGKLPDGTRVGRAAIAQVTSVPLAYLAKILQQLVKARFIRSRPGVNGGFELSCSPLHLSMLEVIEAVDGPAAISECVQDENACESTPNCAIRKVLAEAQREAVRVLKAATIAQLLTNAEPLTCITQAHEGNPDSGPQSFQ